MARWRDSNRGPEWPARLLEFHDWQWTEAEILEAAEAYAARHADACGMEEPLPADSWPEHMTARFAFTHFRLRWARENNREQDLIDEMTRNRLRRRCW